MQPDNHAFMIQPFLYIGSSKDKGRGVFTDKKIGANWIVEISPVIVMSGVEQELLDQTLLHDYIFVWGERKDQCCLALGYVSIYNHSFQSNCEYFMDYDAETILIKTMREIEAGEELTLNYNGNWNNQEKVWFPVA